MSEMEAKFSQAIEDIVNMFAAAQAMAKNEFDVAEKNTKLQAENKQLREALMEAFVTIRTWHGPPGWGIYKTSSPEMKKIIEALEQGWIK